MNTRSRPNEAWHWLLGDEHPHTLTVRNNLTMIPEALESDEATTVCDGSRAGAIIDNVSVATSPAVGEGVATLEDG